MERYQQIAKLQKSQYTAMERIILPGLIHSGLDWDSKKEVIANALTSVPVIEAILKSIDDHGI